MNLIEWDLCNRGSHHAWAGVDEAGRGAWAGPVVAACAVLTAKSLVENEVLFLRVNDSKQLSKKKREELFDLLTEGDVLADWGVGHAHAEEIDRINILQATKRSMRSAVSGCEWLFPSLVFVDGNQSMDYPSHYPAAPKEITVVKGDAISCAVACSSIIAKVWRDRWMARVPNNYGFEKHSGYGTAAHKACLDLYGPHRLHRKTFSPIKEMIK